MKKKYRDWIDFDIDQIELIPLSTEEKEDLKEHVLSKSKVKKSIKLRYLATAVILGISVITVSFMSLPALANQIPFIQSVLTYFEDDSVPNINTYTELATDMKQVQSSNGIDVSVEKAVYDGTNIILTYTIQTEAELGDNPRVDGMLDIPKANSSGSISNIRKINDTTYAGIEKVTPHFKGKSLDEIQVSWQPTLFENMETNKKFEGNWQFEFTLSELVANTIKLNQSIQEDGITLSMKSLKQTELTAVLQYEFNVDHSILKEWPFVIIEMVEVKDNLGNTYEIDSNGGVSMENGTSNKRKVTIYSLNPNAKSLILTPKVYFSKGSGKLGETKQISPVTIDLK
ncbi:DUF4179 domain-containing protein [uncultured Rummeliibacillus sp.]|uniref:DUF4179 domain-containing protein n=1 Tax=uncultured Rummeliibacillus sp. TaxID=762292 RepID=UPI0026155A0E|nr:DUF4179 domain-containing protein [uncultured Rummeliibacillus sp.]